MRRPQLIPLIPVHDCTSGTLPAAGSDKMAAIMKSIASYVEERGITERELATTAGLDLKLVKAIVSGNFTPSPMHRQRLAAALGVSLEDVSWGHAVPVEHLRGNGPQCGRPT